jgi:hypothetical protein
LRDILPAAWLFLLWGFGLYFTYFYLESKTWGFSSLSWSMPQHSLSAGKCAVSSSNRFEEADGSGI